MCHMEVREIIEQLGGPARVAKHIKSKHKRGHISTAAVCQWAQVPAEHCITLAELSDGRLTVHDLRPDIFGRAAAEVRDAA